MNARGYEMLDVVYIGKNNKGKLSLSRRRAVAGEHDGEAEIPAAPPANVAIDELAAALEMDEEEAGVIAAAVSAVDKMS